MMRGSVDRDHLRTDEGPAERDMFGQIEQRVPCCPVGVAARSDLDHRRPFMRASSCAAAVVALRGGLSVGRFDQIDGNGGNRCDALVWAETARRRR